LLTPPEPCCGGRPSCQVRRSCVRWANRPTGGLSWRIDRVQRGFVRGVPKACALEVGQQVPVLVELAWGGLPAFDDVRGVRVTWLCSSPSRSPRAEPEL
jgi:hypothetical protein